MQRPSPKYDTYCPKLDSSTPRRAPYQKYCASRKSCQSNPRHLRKWRRWKRPLRPPLLVGQRRLAAPLLLQDDRSHGDWENRLAKTPLRVVQRFRSTLIRPPGFTTFASHPITVSDDACAAIPNVSKSLAEWRLQLSDDTITGTVGSGTVAGSSCNADGTATGTGGARRPFSSPGILRDRVHWPSGMRAQVTPPRATSWPQTR